MEGHNFTQICSSIYIFKWTWKHLYPGSDQD